MPERENKDADTAGLAAELQRIRAALERMAPAATEPPDFEAADAFTWQTRPEMLQPVPAVNRVDIALLKAIDSVKAPLLENTRRFAQGFAANNALVWGARGMGKSSVIKAAHGAVAHETADDPRLILIEIHREDIATLPRLLSLLRGRPERFILFCDDLSFDRDDTSYKSLKAVLEGGVEGRPANVIFYATSNRRHLMPRDMMENERSTAINPAEAVEEKVSLSDRFGLWLGVHPCSQDEYLAMVDGYAEHYGLEIGQEDLHRQAIEWSVTRGARSGRVAWQFIQHIAGELGRPL